MKATFVPAKNKGWGCNHCKFFQYVEGANLITWKGKVVPAIDTSTKAKFVAHSHRVKGVGPKNARIMFVGEAPGREEDAEGTPFIGEAGQLLDKCLVRGGLERDEMYITNIVKCRPPNNDTPSYTNCVACSAYLSEEVLEIKPAIIVALGKPALQALLGHQRAKITDAHGHPFQTEVAGHPCILFPMWHPSYVGRFDHLADDYREAFKQLGELADKLEAQPVDAVVEKDAGEYPILTSADDCIAVLGEHTNTDKITAFDFETSGLDAYKKGGRIATMSVAANDQKGYCIPLYYGMNGREAVPEEIEKLDWSKEDWLRVVQATQKFLGSTTPKIGHGVKFDMKWSESVLGVLPEEVIGDTLLSYHVVDENSAHDLKAAALRYTNMGAYDDELDAQAKKYKKRYDLIPLPILGKYCAMDSVATLRVYDALCDEAEEQGDQIARLAFDVLPRAMLTLRDLESRGAAIDLGFSQELHVRMSGEIDDLDTRLREMPIVQKFITEKLAAAKETKKKFKFSVNSPKQMVELFFGDDYLDYVPLSHKYTDKGQPQIDKEVLQHLIDTRDCKVAQVKKDLALKLKLQSTYIESIMTKAMECSHGSFLHGNFNGAGTVTGRLSSSGPNLQNIPNKGAAVVKRMFVSRFGVDGCLLSGDYSQIELRLLAAFSGDKRMVRAFCDGEDIHQATMMRIFNMSAEAVKRLEKKDPYEAKRRRTIAKRINFGIAYGIGAEGIVSVLRAEGVVISKDLAREYIDKFYEVYPGVYRWIMGTHDELALTGFLASAYGRRRRLPAVFSVDEDFQSRAMRQGTNHEIQSPASDTTLTALILLNEYLADNGFQSVPIITVHDSVIFDCLRSEVEEVATTVRAIMENIPQYGPAIWGDDVNFDFLEVVPIKVDIEAGINWRDLVPVKDTVSEALMKSEMKDLKDAEVVDEDALPDDVDINALV